MTWTIYRQELALFHARHKRIRFFYEDPGQGAASKNLQNPDRDRLQRLGFTMYRQQVQSIFGLLRDAATLDSDSPVQWGQSNLDDEVSLTINIPKAIDSERTRNALAQYFHYSQAVLKYECVQDDSLDGYLSAIRTDPSASATPRTLPKSSLLNLVSAIPVLPHWDTPGAFSSTAKPKQRCFLEHCSKPEYPIYLAHLEFGAPVQDGVTPTASQAILGYDVRLNILHGSAIGTDATLRHLAVKDYFTYCHHPEESESAQYQAYGCLIDAIQLALAGKDTNLYCIAYPIRTLMGRTHFWHVWLRTDETNASLSDLWTKWRPAHDRFDWTSLHSLVAFQLDQIDAVYAQAAMTQSIAKDLMDGHAADVNKAVCSNGNMLFPVTSFSDGKMQWAYSPYWWHEGERVAEGDPKAISVGKNWESATQNASMQSPETCVSESIKIGFAPAERALTLNKWSEHRKRLRNLRVLQQLNLATATLDAVEAQRKAERRRREQWRIKARIAMRALDRNTRSDWIASVETMNFASVTIKVGENTYSADQFVREWLGGTTPDSTSIQAVLLQQLRIGLHEYLTDYVELDPVKMLSHAPPAEILEYEAVQAYKDALTAHHTYWHQNFASLAHGDETHCQPAERCPDCDRFDSYQSAIKRATDCLTNAVRCSTEIYNIGKAAGVSDARNALRITLSKMCDIMPDEHFCTGNISLSPTAAFPRLFAVFGRLERIIRMIKTLPTCSTEKMTVFLFRLPLNFEIGQTTLLFRTYFLFLWNGKPAVGENFCERLKEQLLPIAKAMQGLGSCFAGHFGTNDIVDMRSVSADEVSDKPVDEAEYWPAPLSDDACAESEIARDVNNAKLALRDNNKREMLLLAVDGWYVLGAQ